jgi:hypothetical protein
MSLAVWRAFLCIVPICITQTACQKYGCRFRCAVSDFINIWSVLLDAGKCVGQLGVPDNKEEFDDGLQTSRLTCMNLRMHCQKLETHWRVIGNETCCRRIAWRAFWKERLLLLCSARKCREQEATKYIKKRTPWSESASELYRPIDRRLLAKWLPTFADRGCRVVSVTDPYGRIIGFLDKP